MNKLSDKTLTELIDHYIMQVEIADKIDYADKITVKANNKAVETMYEIVELIKTKFGTEGISKFATLLDRQENSTFLWVAPQILEKMNAPDEIRKKALKIIKNIADSNHSSALGFQGWLMNYESKVS
ncbi:MAG TPA: hypothetical protein PKN75_09840 [Bacteroidia bacterium]|nr:hypothetical protein [Bacteroidia bacterium]